MKLNVKWTLILIGLLIVFFFTTGAVHNALEDRIAENAYDTDEDIDITNLLPDANTLKPLDIELPEDGPVIEVQEAYDNDELKGYLIKTDAEGAYSTISLATAIDVDGNITGIEVLAQNETEGLGDDIAEDEFTDRFRGKATEEPLKLVQETTSANDEIESITGATISAQAVVTGVNDAIEFYNVELKGGE